jgi:hypothetical protein
VRHPWCTRERKLGHVEGLELTRREAAPSIGDERFGGIDSDDLLGPNHLVQEFGGESRSAAQVEGHPRDRRGIGSEELSGD